jgi:hypothetical protein
VLSDITNQRERDKFVDIGGATGVFVTSTPSSSVRKHYTNAGAIVDDIVWSPTTGTKWHITDIFVGVSEASTVTLKDALVTGKTPIFKHEFAANSGWSHSFRTPLSSLGIDSNLIVSSTAGNIYITITGYEL